MKRIVINKPLAMRVLEVVDKGLTEGEGNPVPGQMCVEAAVSFACGLPHSDQPECVGSEVRAFKIELNDKPWTSEKSRARGLREVAVAQLGTNTIDQEKFNYNLTERLKSALLPMAVKQADIDGVQKKILDFFLENINKASKGTISEWRSEMDDFCDRASLGAVSTLVYSTSATSLVQEMQEYFGGEHWLRICADACRDVLIEMKSPGAKYLYLCKK
jgi:hypothetical protein